MNPTSHTETKIWSHRLRIILKGFVLLIYRNSVPSNFVKKKMQLENEHDPTAIVVDKAFVELFNKTTITSPA